MSIKTIQDRAILIIRPNSLCQYYVVVFRFVQTFNQVLFPFSLIYGDLYKEKHSQTLYGLAMKEKAVL
jgi:uncharacterized PurR-regulated membrane protein YhhQ (DUF165 family)